MLYAEFVDDYSTTDEVDDNETMTSFNHSYVCTQIMKQLFRHDDIIPMTELTLDIGKGLTPDISVYPSAAIQPNLFRDVPKFSQMPPLAIEVISANQNIQTLLEKAKALVDAGVQTVWTVEPFTRSVFITDQSGDQLTHNQSLTFNTIEVDFRQIFQ